ncbi:methylated-DNA--[protein]-cysteine S-methyltransferase [Frigidibacter sp. MR17.14]|uniref:methylated-DNA--[protein]-cysteine S-methyltransferase n=1 Tax=Frigidibacter sp. MR17.14 TaxID=3126509 RepID=UPI0030131690
MPALTSPIPEDSYHYRVIARALKRMEAPDAPATLEALAAEIGLSPAHFQRTFSAWVGVSPKRYQQYLRLGLARELLAERRTLLDTAAETGLSGTGRLHDLFLRWEAMSPGDFARGAEGLTIRWGNFDTPFGPAVAMGTEHGLCGLGFAAEIGAAEAHDDLARRWPKARFTEDPAALAPWVAAAFGHAGELRLQLVGTPFHIKVWEALLAVPSGHVTTYSDIARAIGQPQASRAVGAAVGRNPISFLIPCHRALAASGALTGYHWGLPLKRAMLAWEAARADAA